VVHYLADSWQSTFYRCEQKEIFMNKAPITHKHEEREKPASTRKIENTARSTGDSMRHGSFSHSHIHIGNSTLQRLLAQRAGDATFALDAASTSRIHCTRSGGQTLNNAVQAQG